MKNSNFCFLCTWVQVIVYRIYSRWVFLELFSNNTIYLYFCLFTVFLLVYGMNSIKECSRKYKQWIYIGLFLLCETTLGSMLIIMWKLFPLHQTDIVSSIANNLILFILILFMKMNILNHLQLIYWEIYEVCFQIKFKAIQKMYCKIGKRTVVNLLFEPNVI